MYPFRDKRPIHRRNRKVCKHYKSYKITLRIDFNHSCGYCNDLDINRIRSYVIDHFVPQTPDGWMHRIKPNKYLNLVYSCSFCNGAKTNKWPTKKASVPNNGIEGFIMPTRYEYGRIFYRDTDGSIKYNSANQLAKYIHKELNLWHPIHSLNWKFIRILSQEKTLDKIYKQTRNVTIKQEINDLKILRMEIVDTINEIYNAA